VETRKRISSVISPNILLEIVRHKDSSLANAALETLVHAGNQQFNRQAAAHTTIPEIHPARENGKILIFDCGGETNLESAKITIREGLEASPDETANKLFNNLKISRAFFQNYFGFFTNPPHSFPITAYLHYGKNLSSAYWDGQNLVFGDGDGKHFSRFAESLEVVAHELMHGVIDVTVNLPYRFESGALTESICDIFALLVKYKYQEIELDEADWIFGSDACLLGVGTRSISSPGTAYAHPEFEPDPQPDHYKNYKNRPDDLAGDWGGVHVNSGIPSKAFYLTAKNLGGYPWDKAARIWFDALKYSGRDTNFTSFATLTSQQAKRLFGVTERDAVLSAWEDVGIKLSRAAHIHAPRMEVDGTIGDITEKFEKLAERVDSIDEKLDEIIIKLSGINGKKGVNATRRGAN
jgi:Zn-dependent metalloprotease